MVKFAHFTGPATRSVMANDGTSRTGSHCELFK
jgi:hypothetical protein